MASFLFPHINCDICETFQRLLMGSVDQDSVFEIQVLDKVLGI